VSAMQAEMGESPRTVPIQIVHSENDQTVDIQSAKILRDSWGYCFDIDTQHAYKVSNGQVGSAGWEHSRYRNGRGKSVIETVFLEGPGHGWYGGNPGNHSFPDAPDIKRSMWKFFGAHPLPK
jgi:poly(3-hydroxybutyrate) depolymerase